MTATKKKNDQVDDHSTKHIEQNFKNKRKKMNSCSQATTIIINDNDDDHQPSS